MTRLLRDGEACPVCRSRDHWHVAPVREKDGGVAPMRLGGDVRRTPIGTLEVYLCAGCGLAEWWATDVRDSPSRSLGPEVFLMDDLPACPSCGERRGWDFVAVDRMAGGDVDMSATTVDGSPVTRLSVTVCEKCRLLCWRASPRELVAPCDRSSPGRCRTCASRRAVVVWANDYVNMNPLPEPHPEPTARAIAVRVGFWGPDYLGRFCLVVCPDCGHVDWVGRELQALSEDRAAGIHFISGASRGGPYR